jgi:hypothetical protein
MSILELFKRQTFTDRPPERQTLTVPCHERADKEESLPILAAAADRIAKSGLVWNWISYDGSTNSSAGTKQNAHFCADRW